MLLCRNFKRTACFNRLRRVNRPSRFDTSQPWNSGKLHQDFGVSVAGSNFLDLDSSTPKKFSRHLILHLPEDQVCHGRRRDRLFLPLSIANAFVAASIKGEGLELLVSGLAFVQPRSIHTKTRGRPDNRAMCLVSRGESRRGGRRVIGGGY